jgi:hypothetical protein
MRDLQTLSVSEFAAVGGAPFRVQAEGAAAAELRLLEASARDGAAAPGGRRPFTLLFRGPTQPALTQGTYVLEGPADIGRLALFLVPVGPDAEGLCYEAVFN